jgi:hypothetical protein
MLDTDLGQGADRQRMHQPPRTACLVRPADMLAMLVVVGQQLALTQSDDGVAHRVGVAGQAIRDNPLKNAPDAAQALDR